MALLVIVGGASIYARPGRNQLQSTEVVAPVPVNPFERGSGAVADSRTEPQDNAKPAQIPERLDALAQDDDPATREEAETLQDLVAAESSQ